MAELKDANTNPWYVLMTLYGAWGGDDLHERNRAAWNAWSCQQLDDDTAAEVAKKAGIDLAETRGWEEMAEGVKAEHRVQMERRNGNGFSYAGFPSFENLININIEDCKCGLNFASYIFSQTANFGFSKFDKIADFRKSVFLGSANFIGAHFSQDAFFGEAHFLEQCFFTKSTFGCSAEFRCAEFSAQAKFPHVRFHSDVNFDTAKFHDEVTFRASLFSGFVKFQNTQFLAEDSNGILDEFRSTKIDFTDSQFEKPTSFREAIFAHLYPNLAGTLLHPNTDFSMNTDEKSYWPESRRQTSVRSARDSCARIRHTLAKQGLPEDEHFFFRREMEFSRIEAVNDSKTFLPRFRAWPYWFFKVFSGYGNSLRKPVRALGELFLIGLVALLGFFAPTLGWLNALGLASAISFSNLLPLFGFGRTFLKDQLLDLPWALQFLSSVQTVLALPLLFFLGLALRLRFRLR